MEEDNRRDEQTVDINAVIEENNKIKEAYAALYKRYNELNNTWMLTRANFLVDIIKSNEFPEDLRKKAIVEFTEFMYPTKSVNVDEDNKEKE